MSTWRPFFWNVGHRFQDFFCVDSSLFVSNVEVEVEVEGENSVNSKEFGDLNVYQLRRMTGAEWKWEYC